MKTRLLLLIFFSTLATLHAEEFYQNPRGLFSTRPDPTASLTTIKRFGPVGLAIDLIQPAFQMRISQVEEGSPAAATNALKPGQIISTINGQRLEQIDPRIQLGKILAKAEATDGRLVFRIQGEAQPVTVQIPVLGEYSETWPLNCPKSERIVRGVADYLAREDANEGLAGIGMLFLLSTGDDRDLPVVQKWARSLKAHRYPWYIGYGGVPLCEYYLRTGDQQVLPTIQEFVDHAVQGQYLDAWLGRGGVSATYGNGHLNAAGTLVVAFYMLAKECGADVPDIAMQKSLQHFYRYAGRGGNPYGDNRTELGFVDNGKNGKLAFAMAAAAALTPNGEDSLYARARDVCAIQSFYTTSFMLHGHTGGGIGEIWRSAAMGLLYQTSPQHYREFMDNRKWHYDLSRRFDGSFGILGGASYDKEQWGIAYPLAYTIPRRTLRISGKPPGKYSRQFQLPSQPWGTAADNEFLSLQSARFLDGTQLDLSKETLRNDSSMPILQRLHNSGRVDDQVIRNYIHHQDHNIRFVAASLALGINSGYIGWRSPAGTPRTELVTEFLRHEDPRVRRAMFSALQETLVRERRSELLTPEIFQLAVQAVADPNEAWSVQDPALQLIGHAQTEWVLPHVELLLRYLDHDDWWLQNAALTALTPVVADERSFRRVLPRIGELIRTNQRTALTAGLMPTIRNRIQSASPAVKQLAIETLRESYTGYEGTRTAQGGQDLTATFDAHLTFIASSLADVPGGLDVLFEIAKERHPNQTLPYREFFLNAEPSQFGPKLRKAIPPLIFGELIPEFVGRNRTRLHELAAANVQSGYPGGSRDAIDGLAALYHRAGELDYEWKIFMDLRSVEWSSHSFDPIVAEQVPFDQLITRYRPVTLSPQLNNWFETGYDVTAHGNLWKTQRSPFGNYQGKLPTGPVHKCGPGCQTSSCYGATPINSLWEKEVLLMRGTFAVPEIKPGHRYRLRVNDGNHVGSGGGHIIFINGRPLVEMTSCNGRGSGGLPKGAYLTSEFMDELRSGEITIAAMTFLRYNDKYKVPPSEKIPQGKFSLHIEEQRLPPMDDDLLLRSATVVSMLSSEWQEAQNPADRERQAAARKFQYDGRFQPNPQITGSWTALGTIRNIDDFDPETRLNPRTVSPAVLRLKEGGQTDDPTRIWSGFRLMDLTRYEMKLMKLLTIAGTEYLLIEAGGFSSGHPAGWKTSWHVYHRAEE